MSPNFLNSNILGRKTQKVDFNNLPNISQKRRKFHSILTKNSTPFFVTNKDIFINRLHSLTRSLDLLGEVISDSL